MRISVDDRRLMYGDVFGNADGDVNIVTLFAGSPVCGWHRHESQDDQFFVIRGTVKVGWLDRGGNGGFITLCREQPGPVTIEAGSWHGYKNIGSGDAIIVQWLNRKYNPDDEQRKSVAEMDISWETAQR